MKKTKTVVLSIAAALVASAVSYQVLAKNSSSSRTVGVTVKNEILCPYGATKTECSVFPKDTSTGGSSAWPGKDGIVAGQPAHKKVTISSGDKVVYNLSSPSYKGFKMCNFIFTVSDGKVTAAGDPGEHASCASKTEGNVVTLTISGTS